MVLIVDTKKSKEESKTLIHQLTFPKCVVADSRGFSVGIWLMWYDDEVDVEGEVTTPWAIHAITFKRKHLP